MTTALIDGDTFIFAAASANEYESQWSPWLWTLHAEFEPARVQLDDSIARIVEDIGADSVVVALTDSVNWRKSVMPTYKHNRVAKRKPVIYSALREYVAEKYTTYQRPGLEGDDILGILSTHRHLIKGDRVLVSLDKDMATIPGKLLNYGQAKKAIAEQGGSYADYVHTIHEDDADWWHMIQTLTGDVTDGYPGCPGVGMVRAEKLLGELRSSPTFDTSAAWGIVVAAYQKAGLSEDVALLNARVARILRACDYDFQTKEVRLWNPPMRG